MARRRVEVPPASDLRALIGEGGTLALRVTPGARSEALTIEDGRVSAKVRAKPQDGAANAAVCLLVATALHIAPSRVAVLRGATSRQKVLEVSD